MTQAAATTPMLPCLVCSLEQRRGQELCTRCTAPMVLARQAAESGRPPNIVTAIGQANVGKTTYLGVLLDMLAQRASFGAAPVGTFSVELQEHVVGRLAHRMFPPKTPAEPNRWHWAYYEVSHPVSGDSIDLVVPDVSGAAILAEVTSPGAVAMFRHLLNQSAGLLFCIDVAAAARGTAEPDLFAAKMVSYLDATLNAKRKGRIATPIAVVLCKSDYCPEAFDDPGRFVRANLGRLWNACHSRFERVEFFATSVVGSVGYATDDENASDAVAIPLHTAPTQVLEPLEWLLSQR